MNGVALSGEDGILFTFNEALDLGQDVMTWDVIASGPGDPHTPTSGAIQSPTTVSFHNPVWSGEVPTAWEIQSSVAVISQDGLPLDEPYTGEIAPEPGELRTAAPKARRKQPTRQKPKRKTGHLTQQARSATTRRRRRPSPP